MASDREEVIDIRKSSKKVPKVPQKPKEPKVTKRNKEKRPYRARKNKPKGTIIGGKDPIKQGKGNRGKRPYKLSPKARI